MLKRAASVVRVGVHLQHQGPAGHFARELLHIGGGHLTRPAPGGPKIHQHGNLGCADNLIECACVHIKGLAHGLEGRLAFATASRVGQVICRDAVLGAAGGADGDG